MLAAVGACSLILVFSIALGSKPFTNHLLHAVMLVEQVAPARGHRQALCRHGARLTREALVAKVQAVMVENVPGRGISLAL